MDFKTFDKTNLPEEQQKNEIVAFLYGHLDEFGDPIADIEKAVDYALHIGESFGGYVVRLTENEKVIGAVVVNRTGMKGYIPENILVYIAIHRDYRGKGIGKGLMQEAMKQAKGDIALHVEPENPAKYLYEKLGFTNKYLEMRYKQTTA
ncbi:MAG: GNAT family N-acetyltransferase [Bacteroidales bacterium]|nr:GNAT family N-acetyltransferase [Bacteroidales bacterium]